MFGLWQALPVVPDMTFYASASTRTVGLREIERSLIFQYVVEGYAPPPPSQSRPPLDPL